MYASHTFPTSIPKNWLLGAIADNTKLQLFGLSRPSNALARTQSINMYFAPCGGIFMTIYGQQEIHTKQKLRSVSFVNALMIYIHIHISTVLRFIVYCIQDGS